MSLGARAPRVASGAASAFSAGTSSTSNAWSFGVMNVDPSGRHRPRDLSRRASIPSPAERPEALKMWLTSIALFKARRVLRSRRVAAGCASRLGRAQSFASRAVARTWAEAMRCTYLVLNDLPTDERIAFALRFLDGMELAEIAAVCRTSVATIKRRLRRAEERFLRRAAKYPVLVARIAAGTVDAMNALEQLGREIAEQQTNFARAPIRRASASDSDFAHRSKEGAPTSPMDRRLGSRRGRHLGRGAPRERVSRLARVPHRGRRNRRRWIDVDLGARRRQVPSGSPTGSRVVLEHGSRARVTHLERSGAELAVEEGSPEGRHRAARRQPMANRSRAVRRRRHRNAVRCRVESDHRAVHPSRCTRAKSW